jgi:hypothetical protein
MHGYAGPWLQMLLEAGWQLKLMGWGRMQEDQLKDAQGGGKASAVWMTGVL